MPVLDGRRESSSSKTNSSNCLLFKYAATAVCLFAAGFSSAIEYWHTDCRATTNSSNCLILVTAVCLQAAGFSSVIEYWHSDRRAKANSSNCLLTKWRVAAVGLHTAAYGAVWCSVVISGGSPHHDLMWCLIFQFTVYKYNLGYDG